MADLQLRVYGGLVGAGHRGVQQGSEEFYGYGLATIVTAVTVTTVTNQKEMSAAREFNNISKLYRIATMV